MNVICYMYGCNNDAVWKGITIEGNEVYYCDKHKEFREKSHRAHWKYFEKVR